MLTIGSKAPDFSLPDQDGKMRSLKDFHDKYLVLYFYPKDNTPGCTIEAIDFTKYLSEFKKYGAAVVGISPDSSKSHCNFIKKQKLKLTLLSDEKHITLKKYEVWGKKKFMGREYMGVLRTTFLIYPDGNIASIWKDVKVKDHALEVLQMLKKVG